MSSSGEDGSSCGGGIEESIRRCEQLLAMSPLAFAPINNNIPNKGMATATTMSSSTKGKRRCSSNKNSGRRVGSVKDNAMHLDLEIRQGGLNSDSSVWKKNMQLLSGSSSKDMSSFTKEFTEAMPSKNPATTTTKLTKKYKNSSSGEEEVLSSFTHKTYSDAASSAFSLEQEQEQEKIFEESPTSSFESESIPQSYYGQSTNKTVENKIDSSKFNKDDQSGEKPDNPITSIPSKESAKLSTTSLEIEDGHKSTTKGSCSPISSPSTDLSQTSSSGESLVVQSSWEGVVEISTASSSLSEGNKSEQNLQRVCRTKEHRSRSVPRESPKGYRKVFFQRSKSVGKEHHQDRLNLLSKPRTEAYKKYAEIKSLIENEKLQQCSFKPIIGRKPNPESPYSASILERIMEIQQRNESRKRARKVFEKEELDNCTFRPQINWNSQALDKFTYQPIEKRFQELQRQRVEKIAMAQQRKDLGLTFKPEINHKSVQICKQKGLEHFDVSDRLTSMYHSSHQDCKNESEKHKITFTPEINQNTDLIIATSKNFAGCSDGFYQRQQHYLQIVEQKKKVKENETPKGFTFRPNIGNSEIILKQSPYRAVTHETAQEKFERLAYKDKKHLSLARERASDAYYSQFNFQPLIDTVSRILAPQTSVRNLYSNEKGRKLKETLEKSAEEQFHKQCPFRPELNTPRKKSNGESIQSVIYQSKQLRKPHEKVSQEQESRTSRELQELKECTFKPAVNPSPRKQSTGAVIKGLDRYLELKNTAKQMKKDHEDLERKVFFSQAYAFPSRQYTIPKPFMLHTSKQGRYQRRPSSALV